MVLKFEVLRILEKARDEVVSGQELADRLSVSRTAVWKAIHTLKSEGYPIHSIANKGYQLDMTCDLLSITGIQSHLKKSNIHHELFLYSTIHSTNDEAKKQILEGAKHGTVIIAEEQSAGKGRFGRPFYSPAHTGIYMSLILRPHLTLHQSVLLTTATAVAICRAIEEVCEQEVQIKWVNDLYQKGKKLGGILTEAVTDFETGTVESLIIGIGLNISTLEFPEELKEIATSLKPTKGSRNQLIAAIINHVFSICEDLEPASFMMEYKRRSIVLGQEIYYIQNKKYYEGRVIDISDEGALIVETKGQGVIKLNSGEITLRMLQKQE